MPNNSLSQTNVGVEYLITRDISNGGMCLTKKRVLLNRQTLFLLNGKKYNSNTNVRIVLLY